MLFAWLFWLAVLVAMVLLVVRLLSRGRAPPGRLRRARGRRADESRHGAAGSRSREAQPLALLDLLLTRQLEGIIALPLERIQASALSDKDGSHALAYGDYLSTN